MIGFNPSETNIKLFSDHKNRSFTNQRQFFVIFKKYSIKNLQFAKFSHTFEQLDTTVAFKKMPVYLQFE